MSRWAAGTIRSAPIVARGQGLPHCHSVCRQQFKPRSGARVLLDKSAALRCPSLWAFRVRPAALVIRPARPRHRRVARRLNSRSPHRVAPAFTPLPNQYLNLARSRSSHSGFFCSPVIDSCNGVARRDAAHRDSTGALVRALGALRQSDPEIETHCYRLLPGDNL